MPQNMTAAARCLNGRQIALQLQKELKNRIEHLTTFSNNKALSTSLDTAPRRPCLGYILVGDRSDSVAYVTLKTKACQNVGIESVGYKLPHNTTETEILDTIEKMNTNPKIDGILVQMPLPDHVEPTSVFESIAPSKDVDGFNPINIGKLAMRSKNQSSKLLDPQDFFIPCTPMGIMKLLDEAQVQLQGKVAVVIGRSNLVGMPTTNMLRQRNCTVIHCHSFTKDLQSFVKQADIVVAACGSPELIRGSWIKPGAVVIDVGINYKGQEDNSTRKLVGDVCYEEAINVASVITPVPGGVGPMTITMLLHNVVSSFERSLAKTFME